MELEALDMVFEEDEMAILKITERLLHGVKLIENRNNQLTNVEFKRNSRLGVHNTGHAYPMWHAISSNVARERFGKK